MSTSTRRPRALAAAIAVALAVGAGAREVDARPQGAGAISYAGECLFGTASGVAGLQIVMTSTSATITGDGACQGNAGPATVSLALSGSGDFACRRSSGAMSGSLQFDPQPPDNQLAVEATAVLDGGGVHLVITNSLGDLYASADLLWPGNLGSSGCVSSSLDGVMAFADS